MNSLIIQHNSFDLSLSKKKRTEQPNTNSSLNIFNQISINNRKVNSQKSASNLAKAELIQKGFSDISNKPSNLESSPQINPFSIQSINCSGESQNPQTAELHPSQQRKPTDSSTGWGHSLIKFIIDRSKNRSIQHQINIIPPDTILHKKTPIITSYKKQTLKYTEQALVTGKKLNQVYQKIKNEFRNLEQIKKNSQQDQQIRKGKNNSSKSLFNIDCKQEKEKQQNDSSFSSHKNITSLTKSSSQVIQKHRGKTQSNSNMITASGVISYKFKSIKAENNLIYNHLKNKSSQQLLSSQLQSIKDRLKWATHRGDKIKYRLNKKAIKETRHKKIAFREGLVKEDLKDMRTTDYLKHVKDQKKKIDKVYGEEGSRLQYISCLMNQLSFDRPLAEDSVSFIDQNIRQEIISNNNLNTEIQKSSQKKKDNINYAPYDDSILLSNRKKILSYIKQKSKQLSNVSSTRQRLQNRSGIIQNNFNFLTQY